MHTGCTSAALICPKKSKDIACLCRVWPSNSCGLFGILHREEVQGFLGHMHAFANCYIVCHRLSLGIASLLYKHTRPKEGYFQKCIMYVSCILYLGSIYGIYTMDPGCRGICLYPNRFDVFKLRRLGHLLIKYHISKYCHLWERRVSGLGLTFGRLEALDVVIPLNLKPSVHAALRPACKHHR